MRHKIRRDESRLRDPQRLWRQRSDNLMANALAAIAVARILIIRSGLPMLRLTLLAMGAAIAKKIETVTRQHEQGDDGDE